MSVETTLFGIIGSQLGIGTDEISYKSDFMKGSYLGPEYNQKEIEISLFSIIIDWFSWTDIPLL